MENYSDMQKASRNFFRTCMRNAAEEIRQIIYIRILTIFSEKFNFKRFKNSDSFYVEGWKQMDKEKLLEEYKKYLEKRERVFYWTRIFINYKQEGP